MILDKKSMDFSVIQNIYQYIYIYYSIIVVLKYHLYIINKISYII